MALIPSFILKRLYVTGSLHNTDTGCQFQIKNTLAPATITAWGPIVIDGEVCPLKDIFVVRGGDRLPIAEVSKARPILFDLNVVVTLAVKGRILTPGEHRFSVAVVSREAGRLEIPFADTVNA